MPELPEVTTTVNGLRKTIRGLVVSDVWTDLSKENPIKQFEGTIKDKKFFEKFKKEVKGKKVLKIERLAKNILIYLDNKKIILIHLKMTGHLLYGKYEKVVSSKGKVGKHDTNTRMRTNDTNGKEVKHDTNTRMKTNDTNEEKDKMISWKPDKNERKSLHDPYNRFIHFVISFSNNKHLAFSDSRKFGKVTQIEDKNIRENKHLKNIGPEPLSLNFSLENFKNCLNKKPNKKIKTVLMDQSIIAGIGNIYSDEMLWMSKINPESINKKIPSIYLMALFKSMKQVLNKGIDFGGDSMSDYRNIYGERGNFQNKHNVYQKKGDSCNRNKCKGKIIRKKVDGRSSHFCPNCQKIFI